jgi:hypothetical protein
VKEMAITKTVTKQTLTLNVEDGVNSQGAAKTKGHNYAGVRPEAEPAAIRLLLLLALLSVMN